MNETLALLIQHHCIAQKWKLSLAESCTGGRLAARLTCIPGCSQYFLGSMVVYSNDLKVNLLGVDPSLLAEHGAVSSPVVGQMAKGVLKLTESDYSLAVSGIAGPDGGSSTKPLGTIWGAIGQKGKEPLVWNFLLSGSREEIMEKSVDILLGHFWTLIRHQKSG